MVEGTAKLADFGRSRVLETGHEVYATGAGLVPVRWTAPEALQYGQYSSASDVWAFGIFMYELYTRGEVPYSDNWTNKDVATQVQRGFRLPPVEGLPRAMYDLMIRCWHPEPLQRPPFSRVLGELQALGFDPAAFGDTYRADEQDARQFTYRIPSASPASSRGSLASVSSAAAAATNPSVAVNPMFAIGSDYAAPSALVGSASNSGRSSTSSTFSTSSAQALITPYEMPVGLPTHDYAEINDLRDPPALPPRLTASRLAIEPGYASPADALASAGYTPPATRHALSTGAQKRISQAHDSLVYTRENSNTSNASTVFDEDRPDTAWSNGSDAGSITSADHIEMTSLPAVAAVVAEDRVSHR